MSKLTNCQIKAQIQGLEASIAGAVQRGDAAGARRREKKLAGYRAELAEREARALNLGTEIQADTRTGGSTPLKGGNRVFILPPHPWAGHAGELIAYETYGMGWQGCMIANPRSPRLWRLAVRPELVRQAGHKCQNCGWPEGCVWVHATHRQGRLWTLSLSRPRWRSCLDGEAAHVQVERWAVTQRVRTELRVDGHGRVLCQSCYARLG